MHDYVKGAFETLSWLQMLLEEGKSRDVIAREVRETIRDIQKEIATDFRLHMRPTRQ